MVRVSSGVAAAVAALVLVGGVGGASAAPSGDRSVTRSTPDGWRLTVSKSGEHLQKVHPLNNAPGTSREALLSLRGRGVVSGAGTSPVVSGAVSIALMFGCSQVLDGFTVGGSAGPSVGVTVAWPPAATIGAQAMGTISANFRPGTIETVELGSRPLAGRSGGIDVSGVQIRVTGCVGTVAVRTVVRSSIRTTTDDLAVTVYGKAREL